MSKDPLSEIPLQLRAAVLRGSQRNKPRGFGDMVVAVIAAANLAGHRPEATEIWETVALCAGETGSPWNALSMSTVCGYLTRGVKHGQLIRYAQKTEGEKQKDRWVYEVAPERWTFVANMARAWQMVDLNKIEEVKQ